MLKDGSHQIVVANVAAIYFDAFAAVRVEQVLEIGVFDGDVVVVVDFVDDDEFIAALEKAFGGVAADKACGARDENFLFESLNLGPCSQFYR